MKNAKEKVYTLKQITPVAILLAFFGIVLGLVLGCTGDVSNDFEYEKLVGEHENMQELCVEIVQNVSDTWEVEYGSLREQHNDLVVQYNTLRQQGLALVEYTEALSEEYDVCLQRVGEYQVRESNLELLFRFAPLLI